MQSLIQKTSIYLIVPVYKNAELTKRCLDSIIANINEISDLNPRIILINDSPDDEAVTKLLRYYAAIDSKFALIENVANLGFVKSVNLGLGYAIKEGRDVILINSDTETFPGTLENLLKVANLDSQIAFVSPRSNNASLCSLPHFYGGVVPSPRAAYDSWLSISGLLPEFHFTPTSIGFYLLIKNVILSNFGGLREDFGIGYEEENELILRANKAGYRAALANHSFAFHAGSASFSLLDFHLGEHQTANLEKIKSIHPEFIPLVQRYESSAHFRSERMLSELVDLKHRRIEIVFELTGLACNHNGTNEFSLAVIRNFHERHASKFNITVVCSPESFSFHDLDELESLRRENDWNPGKYAIAIKLGQPFDLHQINIMENLAPINFYAMLDTIAEDCGYLSITQNLDSLWNHVATHANGLIYISKFSERMFHSRFPQSTGIPSFSRLLPTRLSSYAARLSSQYSRHILILGNHFAHKGSDSAAQVLSAKFPRVRFVVLGANTREINNLQSYRSGTLTPEKIDLLFSQASVVILPSHVEGFGLGLLHALSRKKVVFAREIDVTVEILSEYKSYSGVHLYRDDNELIELVTQSASEVQSAVDDSASTGWEEWVDGLAMFCEESVQKPDIFSRSQARLRQSDLLRRASAWNAHAASSESPSMKFLKPEFPSTGDENKTKDISPSSGHDSGNNTILCSLLAADGSKFVELVYATLLKRTPDSTGESYYYARLESGVPKITIIQEIAESDEAKKLGANIPGLREKLLAERYVGISSAGRALSRLRRIVLRNN